MAAQGSVKNWFTFVNGLNTEGGYFVTPPEAWKEGNNVIPNLDGTITRRNGIDLEEGLSNSVTPMPTHYKTKWAYATAQWKALPDDAVAGYKYNFLVVQYGPRIVIFNNDNLTTSSEILFQFTLTSYPADYFQTDEIYTKDKIGKEPCSFAVINGQLIIVSNVTTPIRIEYGHVGSTFTITPFSLNIRDFEGIDTFGLPSTEQKTQTEWNTYYTDLGYADGYYRALYNLYNQGWTDVQINAYKTYASNKLPANSKMWIYGKDASDNFSASLLDKQDFGSMNAAKGRTIIDLFYQERKATVTFTTQYDFRPTQVQFFAGRAWYAGLQGNMSGRVLFSQVLDNINKLSNCYQANDPTSEIASDLLDSDGGVIEIPEAGQIKKLLAVGKGLLVFATNGVYNISGIDTVFSASNYQVEKLTSVGCVSSTAVVVIESNVIYWSIDGIYVISNIGLEYKVENISDSTIKTLYNNIPFSGKQYATGVYNPSSNEVMWLYNSSKLEDETSNLYGNDSILVFNKILNCYYTHSFSPIYNEEDTEKYVASIFLTSTEPSAVIEETVTNNDLENVLDSADNIVTASVTEDKYYNQQFKFLIVHNKRTEAGVFETIDSFSAANRISNITFPAYQEIYTNDVRNEVMQFKRIGEDKFWSLQCNALATASNAKTSTLFLYDKNTLTTQMMELGYDCITTVMPSTFGALCGAFNKDGTRFYVSGIKNDSTQVIFGYVPFSTAYDFSTKGTFVTLQTELISIPLLARQLLYHDMEFNTNQFGDAFLNTVYHTGSETYLQTIPLTTAEANNYDVAAIYPPARSVSIKSIPVIQFTAISGFAFITKSKGEFVYLYATANQKVNTNTNIFAVAQLEKNYELGSIYSEGGSSVFLNNSYSTDVFWTAATNPWEAEITTADLRFNFKGNYYSNEKWMHLTTDYVIIYGTPNTVQIIWEQLYHNLPEKSTEINTWSNATWWGFSTSVSFADFLNKRSLDTAYRDFYTITSLSSQSKEQSAYVITGYELGDVGPARNKTGMYLSTFIQRTETGVDDTGELINPGSVQMSLQWDFTDQYSTNKWTTPVEVYRQPRAYLIPSFPTNFDDGYPLVVSKSKLRGRGKAVQFKFESKTGHDFNIVGWTGTFVGNTNV